MNGISDDLLMKHPRFIGKVEDLLAFEELRQTPMHSSARGEALMRWQVYNTEARLVRERDSGPALKGDCVFLPRRVDLRNADIGLCCLGRVNLRAARLDGVDLQGSMFKAADFKGASLRMAKLAHCRFLDADLREVDLRGADLEGACLDGARLEKALFDASTILAGASFQKAHLAGAALTGADFRGVDLRLANLVGADLRGTRMSGARVYGCSAWDLQLDEAPDRVSELQANLSIDPGGAELPAVDSLEMAQFISLLLTNPRLRTMLDTVTSRGVLLLGRFTPERKTVLDAARKRLRELGLYPILFDFAPPENRDTRETIKTLAGLCEFVLADVTDASSVPLELEALVTDFVIPFIIVKADGRGDFAMLDTLYHRARDRLSPRHTYLDSNHLVANLESLANWAHQKAEALNALKHQVESEQLLPGGRGNA